MMLVPVAVVVDKKEQHQLYRTHGLYVSHGVIEERGTAVNSTYRCVGRSCLLCTLTAQFINQGTIDLFDTALVAWDRSGLCSIVCYS